MNEKRIISKNPHRREDNRDLFDHMYGQFVVTWVGNSGTHVETFPYTGNNMYESEESRRRALRKAREFKDVFTPFAKEITIDEIH